MRTIGAHRRNRVRTRSSSRSARAAAGHVEELGFLVARADEDLAGAGDALRSRSRCPPGCRRGRKRRRGPPPRWCPRTMTRSFVRTGGTSPCCRGDDQVARQMTPASLRRSAPLRRSRGSIIAVESTRSPEVIDWPLGCALAARRHRNPRSLQKRITRASSGHSCIAPPRRAPGGAGARSRLSNELTIRASSKLMPPGRRLCSSSSASLSSDRPSLSQIPWWRHHLCSRPGTSVQFFPRAGAEVAVIRTANQARARAALTVASCLPARAACRVFVGREERVEYKTRVAAARARKARQESIGDTLHGTEPDERRLRAGCRSSPSG